MQTLSTCSNCGETLSSDQKLVCPKCGARQHSSATPVQRAEAVFYPKSPPASRPKLSLGLMALSAVGAAESIAYALRYNFNPNIAEFTKLSAAVPSSIAAYFPYLVGFGGALFVASAYGYFKRTNWAWKLGLASGIVALAGIFAPNLIGAAVGALSVGFLFTKSVRRWLSHA